jgi:hypothetical protein
MRLLQEDESGDAAPSKKTINFIIKRGRRGVLCHVSDDVYATSYCGMHRTYGGNSGGGGGAEFLDKIFIAMHAAIYYRCMLKGRLDYFRCKAAIL